MTQNKVTNYENIHDFISDITTRKYNKHFSNSYSFRGSEMTKDSKWSGGVNFEEALELLEKGWAPAAEVLTQKLNFTVKAPQTIKRLRPEYNVVGGNASIPRYLQGIPTNMINQRKVPQVQRIVTLTKDIAFHSGFSDDYIQEEGVKALRIIKTLEAQNIRCKLYVYFSARVRYEALTCKVCVKHPDERINVLKIAFPMVHTAMLRRLIFRWLETHPNMCNNYGTGSYGTPYRDQKDFHNSEYYLPVTLNNVETFIKTLKI